MLLITTAAVALAPAAGHAATARFTGTFEASTSVEWDQPYGVGVKDCKGDHYVEQRGAQTWQAKSPRGWSKRSCTTTTATSSCHPACPSTPRRA
jgi:hypothetical protein